MLPLTAARAVDSNREVRQMQATFALRRSAIEVLLVLTAIATLLLVGFAGGYWLKSLAAQSAPAVAAHQPALTYVAPEARDASDKRIGGPK